MEANTKKIKKFHAKNIDNNEFLKLDWINLEFEYWVSIWRLTKSDLTQLFQIESNLCQMNVSFLATRYRLFPILNNCE